MNNLCCLQLFESQECYQHVCSFSCLFLHFRNPKKYEFIELTTVRRGLHNGVIGARLTPVKGNAILCTDLCESLFKENCVFKSFESLCRPEWAEIHMMTHSQSNRLINWFTVLSGMAEGWWSESPSPSLLLCPWARHFTHIASYESEWMFGDGHRGHLAQIGCYTSVSLPSGCCGYTRSLPPPVWL